MKFKLELTEQELNIVLFGLQKLPFETVNELIKNIVAQAQPQANQPKEEVAKVTE